MNEMKSKLLINIVAITGAVAVLLGAYGAHGLKSVVSPEDVAIFKTGVTYHFYHLLAMLGMVILYEMTGDRRYRRSLYLFLVGIFLFSGSLYGLALREVVSVPTGILGPITPLGGLLFMTGWLSLIFPSQKSISNA